MAPAARSPRLVGRAAELAAARGVVASARRGDGGALLVTGEAGIGKSRLLAEVATGAAQDGMTVLSGRAVQGGGTLRAVAEALARPMREPARLESARLRPFGTALRRLVPALSSTDTAGAPADSGPVDATVVLGEGLLGLLDELDPGPGSVLVLEDLHWADPDTVALVSYLADAVGRVPVLLLLSARDDVPAPALAGLSAQPSVTVIPLSRLDRDGVGAMAAACRGGTPVDDAELTALVERSDGLPFLVEELLDQVESSDAGQATVPGTLAGLVAARVGALADAAREVVTVAAVVGGDPDWRLLTAVTGQSEAAVLAALRGAVDGGLLVSEGSRLRWRHALTREAVLSTLLPPERASTAARAADVLVGRDQAGDRAAAAELLAVAGERSRAAGLLLGLARDDAARGALHSADDLLVRAAAAGASPGVVAVERVRVLTLLGQVAEAIETGGAALDPGGVAGDDHAELCLRLARAAVSGGRWSDADAYVERAGRPADARSLVLAADAAFGAGAVPRAEALARAATTSAEPAGPPETLCEALMVVARCVMGRDLAASAAAYGRAAQVAAEHGLAPWRVQALFGLGSVQLTAGNTDAPALTEARELALQVGTLAQAVQVDLLRSDAVLLVDGARAALPLAQQAAEQAGRLGHSALQAMAELTAAADAALAGESATMTTLLGAAESRAHAPPEVTTLAPVVHALPHLVRHDLAKAAALFDQAIPALLPHGSAAPTSYFGLWALLRTATADRDDQARETLRRHHTVCAVTNRAALGYAEAIALGRTGRGEHAAERFADADLMIAGHVWWRRLLRLLALEAAVLDGWGDPVPALRADLAASELAGEASAARTCRALLAAAGAPTRRGRGRSDVPPSLRGLGITSREVDVLALVTDGLGNAQIAARLYVSPRTVETHVASLLAKTGAADRVELRAWATASGLRR